MSFLRSSNQMYRFLQDEDNATTAPGNNDTEPTNSTCTGGVAYCSSTSYDFVAFLIWYIFIVLCCVLPAIFAYRRRLMFRSRMTEQESNLERLRQSNLFILSNLGRWREANDLSEVREKIFTEQLKGTTMIVKTEDLVDSNSSKEGASPTLSLRSLSWKQGKGSSTEEPPNSTAAVSVEQDVVLEDTEYSILLKLPATEIQDSHLVPGVCAICLSAYEEGERVSWSPDKACQHAFHTDCVIAWISKKEEPQCPICRQDFCSVAIVHQGTQDLPPRISFGADNFFTIDSDGNLVQLPTGTPDAA